MLRRRLFCGAVILLGGAVYIGTYFRVPNGAAVRIFLLALWAVVQILVWIRRKSRASGMEALRLELAMAIPLAWICFEGSQNIWPSYYWTFLVLSILIGLFVCWRLFRYFRQLGRVE
jgi:hypothetical protein